MDESMGPSEMLQDHVQNLRDIRDLIQAKLAHDTSRLLGLQTLLNAIKEAQGADLEVGKMSVNWWKDNIEKDVAEIDEEVRFENKKIARCWNKIVKTELNKMDESLEKRLKTSSKTLMRDAIHEVTSVLASIKSMRSRMQGAVSLLRKALEEVQRPDTLLHLGLHTVTHCGLALEELPRTLR